ncbi:MAG: divergent polysaccharide deacetylase family protein [Parvibaculaceae bacterium]
MRRNELRQPLRKRTAAQRLWAKRPSLLQAASFATFVCLALGATWLTRIPHPLAGEPVVTFAIPPLEEVKTASIDKPAEDEAEAPSAKPAEESEDDGGDNVEIISSGPAQTVQTEAAIIVAPRRKLPPAPIGVVAEDTPDGPLPRIGSGNKKPMAVYARTTSDNIIHSDAPKIAIVLGGMGLNSGLTDKAIRDLPGDVTFAFAPYGENLQDTVNRARYQGHEILLQLPLEPVNYPANNPGPKTLVTSQNADANIGMLKWHMSRFAGYVGVTNYMGARFLSEAAALQPIMTEMKKRGLLFVSDGVNARDMTENVAKVIGLPLRKGTRVIDANADPVAIEAALSELEADARANGIAIGTGTGLPATIEAVSEWSKTLGDRGIILIPVSAAFRGRAG